MTYVKTLHVQHIRSHKEITLEFNPQVTIITGANGSGKTSLLEAIYISLQGSSFRGSDKDILQTNSPWWRIDVTLNNQQDRTIKFNPEKISGRKQFVIDNKTTARLPSKEKRPVVLFEPEDLRLLHGSPSRRRQFIDTFISQLNPLYGPTLRKYERALKQRNNLLKSGRATNDELFPWNIALAENGAYIIEQRILFIEQINQNLNTLYGDLAGVKDEVSIHYSHTYIGDIKQKLLNEFDIYFQKDTYLGATTTGPHRHDVIFTINTQPALSIASRGEIRTIVLALKFLEVDIIEKRTGKSPIILLDDVFSELDSSRQKLLTTHLKDHQIIITSATSNAGKSLYHIKLPDKKE